jgi:hypothetical protein
MLRYRCYFLDRWNKIRGFLDIEAPSDTRAALQAEGALRGEPADIEDVELWSGKRLVGRISRLRMAS